MTPTERELRAENERLRQAYDYILASRNSVDKELNEANKELNTLKSAKWIELQEIFHEQLKQEHDKARNQAIDEAIGEVWKLADTQDRFKVVCHNVTQILESLKTKSANLN